MKLPRILAVSSVAGAMLLASVPAADADHLRPSTPGPRDTSLMTRELPPTAQAALEAVRDLLADPERAGLGPRQDVDVTGVLEDSTGRTHTRVEQTYLGLPVIGGDLVVHSSARGAVERISGALDDALQLSTRARISSDDASLRGRVGRLLAERKDRMLVVDALGEVPRLAWRLTTNGTQADGLPSRMETYVDAQNGSILRRIEQIKTIEGQGQSLYGGRVPLSVAPGRGGYELTDPIRGSLRTVDVRNQTDNFLCTLFNVFCPSQNALASSDLFWGSGTLGDAESAAVDAHYGAATTWDYFRDKHGRLGIRGDGRGTVSRVRYGNRLVNAFWDGSKMTYGDGDGVNFGPMASLDIAGHEMAHGVTEATANLVYFGESGGLNEATSDIFGSMVEFSAANPADPGDYIIGEQADLKSDRGLRRLDHPSRDGRSQDCRDSNTARMDVHFSSGVGNHFFYLLAEGSGAKAINGVNHFSPTCNGSTVSGIGRDAAAAIWYRALTVYMTSRTDYPAARIATLNAARDLFGAGSTQYNTVAQAWSAVNVN